MSLKYLSLFSGIGGFEIAIHNIFPDAICIGYSEINKHALKVYQHHFPTHRNLGDITKITEAQIKEVVKEAGGCDLVVGGFPCQNLSSMSHMNHDSTGLQGEKSGLFYELVRILAYLPTSTHILLENNASMKNEYKKAITDTLKTLKLKVYTTCINAADIGVQTRRRLYWTTFEVNPNLYKIQDWDDILISRKKCARLQSNPLFIKNTMNNSMKTKTRKKLIKVESTSNGLYKFIESTIITKWCMGFHSTTYSKCTPIVRQRTVSHNILIDTRFGKKNEFMIRNFDVFEIERLFFFPTDFVRPLLTESQCFLVLGNTVVVKVIEHILTSLAGFEPRLSKFT